MSRLCMAGRALIAGAAIVCLDAAMTEHAVAQEAILSVSLDGSINAGCTLSGIYFEQASAPGAPQDLEDGEIGLSVVDFSDFNDQEIGRFTLLCNSGTATVTVDTANDFQLGQAGSANPIPFTLRIPEVASLSGGFSQSSSFTADAFPGNPVERTLLVNLGPLSAIDFAPGPYSDVIRIVVVPNA
ncbi:MAG: hypothetical protein ABL308_13310 [Oceanicaulis sp.]